MCHSRHQVIGCKWNTSCEKAVTRCHFLNRLSMYVSHDSHPKRIVALNTLLITLRNVITPYRVIRPATRGVLCWLPNVSTVTVFDDSPVKRASWLMILNLESRRSMVLHDFSSSKQQSSYLPFKYTVFQSMQSLLYRVFQTIAGIFSLYCHSSCIWTVM